ncbi:hypothetical protein ABZZ17_15165 [Streptomyces sp. NPDC006512]|uniref:hypothetical protein n=1 Tax=Streptomyces sp. NPDC006512 TaxID=3154307 RepID=UPI0033A57DC0
MMGATARTEWWERLPQGIRDQVDGYVLQDALLPAIRLLVEVGFHQDGVGVGDAQCIVSDRYAHHGVRVVRSPDSPLDLESLACRARGTAGRVVAVEAVWDGDTVHDWFVVLRAITEEPAEDKGIASVYWGMAERYLGEDADYDGRHPAAVAAERAGGALAAHLGVPFHFASPDTPDDEAPRRRAQSRTP